MGDLNGYVGHFRDELQRIDGIQNRLHRKLVIVCLLSALSKGRFPDLKGDRARFVALIDQYADWPDARSVSVVQLGHILAKQKEDGTLKCGENFYAEVEARAVEWRRRKNAGEIVSLSMDPDEASLIGAAATEEDRKALGLGRHASLLYDYRCFLVHEMREPGEGFEFNSRDTKPYYHDQTDLDTDRETVQLVYPAGWFVALPGPIITNLEAYYRSNGVDPYESYEFGSAWR